MITIYDPSCQLFTSKVKGNEGKSHQAYLCTTSTWNFLRFPCTCIKLLLQFLNLPVYTWIMPSTFRIPLLPLPHALLFLVSLHLSHCGIPVSQFGCACARLAKATPTPLQHSCTPYLWLSLFPSEQPTQLTMASGLPGLCHKLQSTCIIIAILCN